MLPLKFLESEKSCQENFYASTTLHSDWLVTVTPNIFHWFTHA